MNYRIQGLSSLQSVGAPTRYDLQNVRPVVVSCAHRARPQVGTLNYMSPEAIQGGSQNPLGGPPLKVGRPSDVWSLGCILYQM